MTKLPLGSKMPSLQEMFAAEIEKAKSSGEKIKINTSENSSKNLENVKKLSNFIKVSRKISYLNSAINNTIKSFYREPKDVKSLNHLFKKYNGNKELIMRDAAKMHLSQNYSMDKYKFDLFLEENKEDIKNLSKEDVLYLANIVKDFMLFPLDESALEGVSKDFYDTKKILYSFIELIEKESYKDYYETSELRETVKDIFTSSRVGFYFSSWLFFSMFFNGENIIIKLFEYKFINDIFSNEDAHEKLKYELSDYTIRDSRYKLEFSLNHLVKVKNRNLATPGIMKVINNYIEILQDILK